MSEDKLKCPNCKSDNTKFIQIKTRTGPIVFGGKTPYTISDSYYSCKNCGIRFDKV